MERNNEELRSYRDALERRDEENRQGKHTDDRNKQVRCRDCLICAVTLTVTVLCKTVI